MLTLVNLAKEFLKVLWEFDREFQMGAWHDLIYIYEISGLFLCGEKL